MAAPLLIFYMRYCQSELYIKTHWVIKATLWGSCHDNWISISGPAPQPYDLSGKTEIAIDWVLTVSTFNCWDCNCTKFSTSTLFGWLKMRWWTSFFVAFVCFSTIYRKIRFPNRNFLFTINSIINQQLYWSN